MKAIEKILVANRGEIARRIMSTCHRMGIATVAVFSDADAGAPFVREADEAIRIGRSPSAESYLRIDALVAAAKRTGADAVHPGYGFLSENAAFARACLDADLVFIGPTPEAILAMGKKKEAKALVAAAGVPVIPGYDGAEQATAVLARHAREVGFPLLLKASAGGGGKGMRIVREQGTLEAAIESARREAESSFGDGTLLVERYIERPRHVEFQILGDSHGNLVHLFERECSIQRRHQKIVEETPSPVLDDALRARMGEAAVKVGKAIDYENAGTVEFIVAPDRSFYFLEVNTRLQVEHPITEMVTGLDLVREQIRIASGEALGYSQEDVVAEGAAIEVRIYAEDPQNDFLPDSGRVVDWHIEGMEGLREDGGIEAGSEISIYYDPMLAKLITYAATRDEAILKMRRALSRMSVQGVKTNQAFLLSVLRHAEFLAGNYHTHFIDDYLGAARERSKDAAAAAQGAVAATVHAQRERRAAGILPTVVAGFRNNPYAAQWAEYDVEGDVVRVEYRDLGRGGIEVRWGFGAADGGATAVEQVQAASWLRYDVTHGTIATPVEGAVAGTVALEDGDGHRIAYRVVRVGDRSFVHGAGGSLTLVERPRYPDSGAEEVSGGLTARMPGKVVKVFVEIGQAITAGASVLVLEAMKMEQTLTAPHDGTVTEIRVAEGDQVEAEALLVIVEPAASSED